MGEGAIIDVLGPLGNAYPIPLAKQTPLIVAGGIGIASVFSLIARLSRRALVFYGARSEDELFMIDELRQISRELLISTDDGSCGEKGTVLDVLKNFLTSRSSPLTSFVIYACGPKPMLKEVAQIAISNSIKAYVSLEENMACGVGTCQGCVVKVRSETEKIEDGKMGRWEDEKSQLLNLSTSFLYIRGSVRMGLYLMRRKFYGEGDPVLMNLEVDIGRLRLRNPVMTASGTFGYGEEYSEFIDLNKLGAIIVKGISLEPMQGNPPPRICETPCGMLNAIGLQNVGLKHFLKEKLPFLKKYDTRIIVNILGNSIKEYVRLSTTLDDAGVDAIELNVSCPNVKKGGIIFGTDIKILGRLVSRVRGSVKNAALITKLSPNVSDIKEFARIAEDSGSDAISLINTIPGLAIDINTRRPRLANITGGLSGPAIKPIALRMVYEAYNAVKIPVIGIGGIMNADDAIEFIIAGATAVAVGTANFINPTAISDILDGLIRYTEKEDIQEISSLIGSLNVE